MDKDFYYSSEPGVFEVSMRDYVKGSKYITAFWIIWIPLAVFGVSLVPVATG